MVVLPASFHLKAADYTMRSMSLVANSHGGRGHLRITLAGMAPGVLSLPCRHPVTLKEFRQEDTAMPESILIPVADGVEDIELVTLIDVLRRAQLPVVVASVEEGRAITAARGTHITADKLFDEVRDQRWRAIILPGGLPGAERLAAYQSLIDLLHQQDRAGAWFGAICASPAFVLAPHGLLKGRHATAYPAFQARLPDRAESHHKVVISEHCVTSQGPGTAVDFALTWVSLLAGDAVRERVASDMLVQ